MLALFRRYPGLAERLPYHSLGEWPTPVRALSTLSRKTKVFIKDDGCSGSRYGGNKVRKLEFVLADALSRGCEGVLTFGVAGSNHALATAVYAQQLGLRCYSLLTPQTNARYVSQNLLAGMAAGAHFVPCDNDTHAFQEATRLEKKYGDRIAVIPGGGSSALGTVGFVNAAFELAEQIENGELPEPDRLYVALGTMGTAVGLTLGLAAAGLATEVVPVRVVRNDIANPDGFAALYRDTATLLEQLDTSFAAPTLEVPHIRHDQYGEKYAVFTESGMQARRQLKQQERLSLEGTYTAKTMAALLHDLANGEIKGYNVLYWHTYNGKPLTVADNRYQDLPEQFHRYFEQPVQPLDRD